MGRMNGGNINKREEKILDAVLAGKDLTLWSPEGEAHDRVLHFTKGVLLYDAEVSEYWLWRTKIAEWRPETKTLRITLNGWTTNTTLHRADAFLAFFGASFRIRRRKDEVSLVGVGADWGKSYEFGRMYVFNDLTVCVEA